MTDTTRQRLSERQRAVYDEYRRQGRSERVAELMARGAVGPLTEAVLGLAQGDRALDSALAEAFGRQPRPAVMGWGEPTSAPATSPPDRPADLSKRPTMELVRIRETVRRLGGTTAPENQPFAFSADEQAVHRRVAVLEGRGLPFVAALAATEAEVRAATHNARVSESAATLMRPALVRLVERASAAPAATVTGRYRARIIEGNRWGSSGYYPQQVLERDGAKAFPAGTLTYIDHPTASDEYERPERSVRDLAGRLVTAARWESSGAGSGGLYADIEVFPHWQPVIEAMRDTIGLSIRAGGTVEEGEVAGRRGRIVTALAESDGSHSVDFVTRAGAGGRIV
jgi:hypothetical protein